MKGKILYTIGLVGALATGVYAQQQTATQAPQPTMKVENTKLGVVPNKEYTMQVDSKKSPGIGRKESTNFDLEFAKMYGAKTLADVSSLQKQTKYNNDKSNVCAEMAAQGIDCGKGFQDKKTYRYTTDVNGNVHYKGIAGQEAVAKTAAPAPATAAPAKLEAAVATPVDTTGAGKQTVDNLTVLGTKLHAEKTDKYKKAYDANALMSVDYAALAKLAQTDKQASSLLNYINSRNFKEGTSILLKGYSMQLDYGNGKQVKKINVSEGDLSVLKKLAQ